MPNYRHRSSALYRYLVTNQAASGDDSSVAGALTETRGVEAELIPFRSGGWDGIMLIPFGADTADDDFELNLWGYWKVTGGSAGRLPYSQDWSSSSFDEQWLIMLIASADCNLSTATGSAGAPCVVADKFCDAVVVTRSGFETATGAGVGPVTTCTKFDPAANTAAAGLVCSIPIQPDYLWIGFDIDGGDGTAGTEANTLYQLFAT